MLSIFRKFFLTLLIINLFYDFSFAQKFLALDIYHVTGNMKRIRFHENDNLTLRIHGSRKFFTHVITFLGDCSIVLDGNWILPLSEIDKVRIDRSNSLVHTLSRGLIDCGIGFFVLDSFNSLVNSDFPIVKIQAVKESAVLILSGIILQRVMIRKYRINSRRRLKIIDVTF